MSTVLMATVKGLAVAPPGAHRSDGALTPVTEQDRARWDPLPIRRGLKAGLRLVDEIVDDDALRHYAPLPAARGDFLFRAGRLAEARSEFQAAATLTRNMRERPFFSHERMPATASTES